MRMPAHSHDLAYLSIVRDGSYTKVREDGTHCLKRSMIAFHPAGEVHADCIHQSAAVTFNIELQGAGYPQEFYLFQEDQLLRQHDVLLASLQRGYAGQTQDAIRELLRLLPNRGNNPARPRWISEVYSRLNEPLSNISVQGIARQVGKHRGHLHRTFRRSYGTSLRSQLTWARANAAAMQLAKTGNSLAEIALACGYADQSHFSHQFKKSMGMTPASYRRVFSTR
jgi:AraC family transcriptional regulator